MDLDKLYSTIEDVELEQKYLFIVYDQSTKVGIDVLDWDSEEQVDGAWFNSTDEAVEFVNEFKGSL